MRQLSGSDLLPDADIISRAKLSICALRLMSWCEFLPRHGRISKVALSDCRSPGDLRLVAITIHKSQIVNSMNLVLVGISHRTAPVEIRERNEYS